MEEGDLVFIMTLLVHKNSECNHPLVLLEVYLVPYIRVKSLSKDLQFHSLFGLYYS